MVSVSVASAAGIFGGEHWASYRGPTDQGHCDSAALPLRWSEDENVVWKTPLAGKAWSSPVIWGDRIWLTNATEDGSELSVLCFDKSTGKVLINKQLHRVDTPQDCHVVNSYASPSPVIEDGRLYVSFGSPYNACLDSQNGEVLWQRTDFVCNHFRGAGSSPVIFQNLLFLNFDGSDRQYVAALDKRTGKTVWQTNRSIDFQDLDPQTGKPTKDGDFHKAFSTPLVVEVGGKPILVSLGSMALYGYEPATGKELWRVESLGSHSGCCRPVAGHGLVFVPIGYTAPVWAVRPDGQGVVTESHVAWKYPRGSARRSSLLLVDDWLFMVDSGGVAACIEAKTGKELWRERLGGNYSASPLYAGGRIYFYDEGGKATIIEAAAEFKRIAENQLSDGCMASPAVSGGALYVRTKEALYRIESVSRSAP